MAEEELNVFKSNEIKHFLFRSKNIKRENMQLIKNLETKKDEFDKHMNAQVDHFKKKLTRTQSLDLQVAFGHQKGSNSSQTDGEHLKLPFIDRSKSSLQKPMKCGGRHVVESNDNHGLSRSPKLGRIVDSVKGEEVVFFPTLRRGSLPDPSSLKSFLSSSACAPKERDVHLDDVDDSGPRSARSSPLLLRRKRQTLTLALTPTIPTSPRATPPASPLMPRNLAMREQQRRELSLRNSFSEDSGCKTTSSLEEQFKALEHCRYLRCQDKNECESKNEYLMN